MMVIKSIMTVGCSKSDLSVSAVSNASMQQEILEDGKICR